MAETMNMRLAALALLLGLSACAPAPLIPPPLVVEGAQERPAAAAEGPRTAQTEVQAVPAPPALQPSAKPGKVNAELGKPPGAASDASLNLEQVSIGYFAQLVFADVLKRNVNVDPQVMSRKDLVTFRSGGTQSPEALQSAATLLLKSYGIAVVDVGGLVRVLPDNANLGNLPEIRRGLALPDTPLPLRPVFHLVELQAVRTTDVVNWLRTMFGERVKLQEDGARNAILINGTPDNVMAALEAIRMLDQPAMAGGLSTAIRPLYGSAEELARRLTEVLSAQGYAVQPMTGSTAIRYPLVVLPVPGLNAVYVFARGQNVIDHVVAVARSLDQPNPRGIGKNFFTYSVRHKDAATLADTLSKLLSGTRASASSSPAAAPGTQVPGGQVAPAASSVGGGVVVDASTNTLIFQAQQDEYSQLLALLQALDKPSKSALIEVTVAELNSDDTTQLGIQWSFTDGPNLGGNGSGGFGPLGAPVRAANNFVYQILNNAGGIRLGIQALARANRATILSSPRVLARNGETSTIQVGNDVPVLTQQTSTPTAGSGTTQINSIQYRNTGVILKVKPVIHSGDQVDIDVIQEVSDVVTTETGVGSSPVFQTRKLDTKLTLRSGATVLLGGLLSESRNRGNAGIPWLKDLPIIGGAFGNQSGGGTRRELLVLITPYVLNDGHEAEQLTEAFRKRLGSWAQDAEPKPAPNPMPQLVN